MGGFFSKQYGGEEEGEEVPQNSRVNSRNGMSNNRNNYGQKSNGMEEILSGTNNSRKNRTNGTLSAMNEPVPQSQEEELSTNESNQMGGRRRRGTRKGRKSRKSRKSRKGRKATRKGRKGSRK